MVIKDYGLALRFIDYDKLEESFHKIIPYISGNQMLTLERYAKLKLEIDILDIYAHKKLNDKIINFKLHLIQEYLKV